MAEIILASASPRRRELLSTAGVNFTVKVADVVERIEAGLTPDRVVMSLALQKAQAVAAENPEAVVIGADTVVILNEKILGKPKDEDDAFLMLRALSGRTHTVITGCCITDGENERRFSDSTEVTFYDLSDEEIREYIATGDPMDKAGAYGIQEKATLFVKGIKGDFFNVVGLPIAMLYRELKFFEEIEE